VLIHIVVDAHGNVESASVKQTSGFDRLDDAARTAALGSPCKPYTEGGTPVRAMTDVPFKFTLND
jgi:protein TonB